ncbi:MAG: response regulator [Verrucomicrobiaceae bacterium]|nr:response regulator [Verrucomicrobiaceae bacterium]
MAQNDETGKERLAKAFAEYDRPIRIRNYRLAAFLAMLFMPAGASLDYFVYGPAFLWDFLPLRLGSALILGVVWMMLGREEESVLTPILARLVALVPAAAICYMIYLTEGAESPYYAGLNLVMLGTAILLRWTFLDSVMIFLACLGGYLWACWGHGPIVSLGLYFNNIYFITVTGVFVIVGMWFYNRILLSEFLLRDAQIQQKADLEEANSKLALSNQRLRDADELKSRFFANVSHELRTPLTLMLAPLEMVLSRNPKTPLDEVRPLLGTMQDNVRRLLGLINDLLDLVRMESSSVAVKSAPIHVAHFLDGLASAISPAALAKGLVVTVDCANDIGKVLLDVEKMERICLNLAVNAMKFTPPGGSLTLMARKSGDRLIVEVRDTGPGISPEDLPRVFERYWQGSGEASGKHSGLGIGLALVQELVEVQGGHVEAESDLGAGTTFRITLPYLAVEESTSLNDVPDAEALADSHEVDVWVESLRRRAHVLSPPLPRLAVSCSEGNKAGATVLRLMVVDDELAIRRFVGDLMRGEFEVREVDDGLAALQMVKEWVPDIVLTDMMMPNLDGLELCKRLRALPATRNAHVVMLTARIDEATKLACLEAGATDFICKPFSITELSVRLRNLAADRLNQKQLAERRNELELAVKHLRDTEDLLIRHEKLASLGRLSAGLVHEINNPLNYAVQGLFLIRKMADKVPNEQRPDFLEILDDVEGGIHRVVNILADLHGFTRTGSRSQDLFELRPAVATTLRFFAHEFKSDVDIVTDVPPGIRVKGDGNQFNQVLVNLIQNGIDALKTKEFKPGERPRIEIRAEAKDGIVFLHVKDNGPGIPAEIQTQIFEPFFTTKEVGEGLGLGLAITFRIVADFGGRITINSEPGLFCEFLLELPQSDEVY